MKKAGRPNGMKTRVGMTSRLACVGNSTTISLVLVRLIQDDLQCGDLVCKR